MIKIHNNGKEKDSSFGAYIDFSEYDEKGSYNVSVGGYGATEKECLESLTQKIMDMAIAVGGSVGAEIEYVDCLGEPINKKI